MRDSTSTGRKNWNSKYRIFGGKRYKLYAKYSQNRKSAALSAVARLRNKGYSVKMNELLVETKRMVDYYFFVWYKIG